jgi:hypothetical protein
MRSCPAIHDVLARMKDVDARNKCGHDVERLVRADWEMI